MTGRMQLLLWLSILSIILSGCKPIVTATGMELADQPDVSPHVIRATSIITKQATPTWVKPEVPAPPVALTSPTPSLVDVTQTSEPVPLQPTPNCHPQILICCPLEDFPLDNVAKIVSVPYDPPPMGSDDRHQGVDFVYHRLAGVEIPIIGVPVNSVLPGFVAASVTDSFPYGSLVIIETPGDWLPAGWLETLGMHADQSLYILYAHLLEKPPVNLGDEVDRCQMIGQVGMSGNTDAAHLHLETRIGPAGQVFPSMYGLLADAPAEARQNYKLWRTSGVFQHFDPMLLLSGLEIP